MKITEKLNEGIYLGTRESAGWDYRCVIRTETSLEEGQTISSSTPIECKIKSLCEETQIFFFGVYSDEVDVSEKAKQIFLEVIMGEEDAQWAYDFAHGNEIF